MTVTAALPLAEAVATAATGDVWLFRGRSLADRAIQTVTNSPVNHVGMVVALDDLPPLLWHAELGKSLPDVWTGQRQRGVQLHLLEHAVTTWGERYGQRAWVRAAGTARSSASTRTASCEVIERFDGRSFPTTVGLARQWAHRPLPPVVDRSRPSTVRSSSATRYQQMGLLPAGGRRAGTTRAASGAATGSSSCRRSRSPPRWPYPRTSMSDAPHPELRASDADRERAADTLRRAAGVGRLTMDELDERLNAAYALAHARRARAARRRRRRRGGRGAPRRTACRSGAARAARAGSSRSWAAATGGPLAARRARHVA